MNPTNKDKDNNPDTQNYLGFKVGPCAWDAALLFATPNTLPYIEKQDALWVVWAKDSPEQLSNIGQKIKALRKRTGNPHPIMLMYEQPEFARQLKEQVKQAIKGLGLNTIDLLMMCVEDLIGIKAGRLIQSLRELASQGLTKQLGLFAQDPRWAQWLAINTAVRAIGTFFDLQNQDAKFQALQTIQDYSMVAFAFPKNKQTQSQIPQLAFALGNRNLCVPVISQLNQANLPAPMSQADIDQAWQDYQNNHPPVEPLPRGLPPQ